MFWAFEYDPWDDRRIMGVGSKCACEVLVAIAMVMGGWIVPLKDGTCDFPKHYEKSLGGN